MEDVVKDINDNVDNVTASGFNVVVAEMLVMVLLAVMAQNGAGVTSTGANTGMVIKVRANCHSRYHIYDFGLKQHEELVAILTPKLAALSLPLLMMTAMSSPTTLAQPSQLRMIAPLDLVLVKPYSHSLASLSLMPWMMSQSA